MAKVLLQMNKLLVISGPTATGKTDLAVKLAQKYNGELVSGDSCQIYKGMDIGTGKDQPPETPIHLIDLITPDQKFSVVDFQTIGIKKIKEIQSRNKLPILVGCSGFYIDSIINSNYNTFSIKPNKLLRFVFKYLSLNTLQKIYQLIDKEGFSKLNHSDINNSYRLTRKIEIKLFNKNAKHLIPDSKYNLLHISLTAPLDYLYKQIDARVNKRIEIGFLDEIKNLLKKYNWTDPGMKIAAYQCLKPYFINKNPTKSLLNTCLQKWAYAEHSDARRQTCWFKTKSKAVYFDITSKNYQENISKSVDKWYNKL
jgi:tRNA dimethylallyltransferase